MNELQPDLDRALEASGVCISRSACTPEECTRIVELFKTRCHPERDVRQEEAVSRVNYWEPAEGKRGDGQPSSGEYAWIFERIIEKVRQAGVATTGEGASAEWGFDVTTCTLSEFASHMEFVLMHEFKGKDYFDWHIDTNPSDGTGRTVNVNIMLSAQGAVYSGGDLLVGRANCHAEVGDLYWYPAAYPHKVDDISGGIRHTMIIAMRAKSDGDREQTNYFKRAENNFKQLLAADSSSIDSKWRLLYGNYLLACKPPAEELADDQFAAMYASTAQAAQYAEHFDQDGQRLLAAGQLAEALKTFRFAVKVGGIDGGGGLFQKHVEAVEEMLRQNV